MLFLESFLYITTVETILRCMNLMAGGSDQLDEGGRGGPGLCVDAMPTRGGYDSLAGLGGEPGDGGRDRLSLIIIYDHR